MRVAALYDIHANLPALEAVLDDVRKAGVNLVVVMPRRATGYPQAVEFAAQNILHPPSEEAMARAFAHVSFR
jgi:hypothetical protein